MFGISFTLSGSWVINKNVKYLVSVSMQKPYLILTQDLNKIKKYAKHSLVDIGKWEACANFQQKVFNGG